MASRPIVANEKPVLGTDPSIQTPPDPDKPVLVIRCGGKVREFHDISCYNWSQLQRMTTVITLRGMAVHDNQKTRAVYDAWCQALTKDFKECTGQEAEPDAKEATEND
ncbi:MAG: hypothetical protein KAT70_08735 [Thermoplasmata archaeon]|nr:hypothetical protein [Thermoplasmata archaeon]